jgi:hypothetical protein
MMSIRKLLFIALAIATLDASGAQAQGRVVPPPDTDSAWVRVAPGPRYDAGPIRRFLLGSGWRDLWVRPLTLPVLPIDTFAGGLTPEREGGNKQSITLHMLDARGRGWVFRSLDKYPADKLLDGLGSTATGDLIQDQISTLHPGGQLMVPPLLEAVGVLHVEPVLYVMPDAERLGEFRETFAGMIGALEPKPNEGENETPGFAGSRKIRDTDDFFEELREHPKHRVAERELLRARLIDFIIGDTDRGTDQYRWARFPHPDVDDGFIWRPLPRDRDWAFLRSGGIIIDATAGTIFPKFTAFGPQHSPVPAHAFSAHTVDRVLLVGLDRSAFREEAVAVQNALTDSVIAEAVGRLPEAYPDSHTQWVREAIRSRRDALVEMADAYYRTLATDVDIQATDAKDHVRITRHPDGRVEVTISAPAEIAVDGDSPTSGPGPHAAAQPVDPYYHRVFLPSETNDVRVFLHDGDDAAVIEGTGGTITVRAIGGDGDDVLADSSAAGNVYFYDAEGDNRIVTTASTTVDHREWHEPDYGDGLWLASREWAPDWGDHRGWAVDVGHGSAAGIVLGFGPTYTRYGFRHLPYHWRAQALAYTGTGELTPGFALLFDYRFENSPHSIEVETSWPGYDSFQWFGYGNDTERLSKDDALVHMRRLEFESAFVWRFGPWRATLDGEEADAAEQGEATDASADVESQVEERALRALRGSIGAGPLVRRSTTEPGAPAGPFALAQPLGFDRLWQVGARAEFELEQTDDDNVPHRGYRVKGSIVGFPGILDLPGAYGTAAGELNGYLPVMADVHLAARLGAVRSLGRVPVFDAAALGGRRSLRGHSSRRFVGDLATYGGVELRVPIGDVAFILPGEIGVFALADAGRVFVDGDSPGGWHTAVGAGFWFSVLDRTVSAAWARGERGTLHIWSGLPF